MRITPRSTPFTSPHTYLLTLTRIFNPHLMFTLTLTFHFSFDPLCPQMPESPIFPQNFDKVPFALSLSSPRNLTKPRNFFCKRKRKRKRKLPSEIRLLTPLLTSSLTSLLTSSLPHFLPSSLPCLLPRTKTNHWPLSLIHAFTRGRTKKGKKHGSLLINT